ncbi:IS6 family transposase [Rhizobium leguminosarum]|uniref:IS6 family transposase n=1 Tax=Rhizobium leguminosarum TaxID=384 RepID=UPI003D15F3FF
MPRRRNPASYSGQFVTLNFILPMRWRRAALCLKGIKVTDRLLRLPIAYTTTAKRSVHQRVRGKKHWLWRAVDQDGFVLEVLVQSRRNAKAAKRLMRKLLKGQGRPPLAMITDKLQSYGAAKREIMPGVEHRSHKGLDNRAENSHQPVRRRERIMKCFKSQRHLQRFVSIHDPIANLFQIPRHDISSGHHRELRTAAMSLWRKLPEHERYLRMASFAGLSSVKFTMPIEPLHRSHGCTAAKSI